MKIEDITDPIYFLNSFSMHDVRIENISIDLSQQIFEFYTDDLNWNYDGSPDYKMRPCTVLFLGVLSYFLDVLDLTGVIIGQNHAHMVGDLIQVDFDLSTGAGDLSWNNGRSSISLQCHSMRIVDR